MNNKTIGLLFFDPHSINKGTAALAYSIIYLLEEIAKNGKQTFNYVFLEPAHADNQIINKSLEIDGREIPVKLQRCFPANTTRERLLKFVYFKDYLKSLKVDYIMDIGEGDSYADVYGEDRFYRFDAMKWVYINRKIPFALLPQTIGPFFSKKIEKQAKKTLNKIDLLYVRDKKTLNYTKQLAPGKKIIMTPDIAFYLPYKKSVFNSTQIHFGVNISGLLWYGGYTQNNQFNLKTDYQKLIRNILDYFLQKENVVIHLIPHVVHEKDTIDNDYPISYKLYNEYKGKFNNVILAPFFMTPVDAKSYISGMDFFVGARLHSTIGAFSSGVPTVPMAYTRKCTGLYCDTLDYEYICDLMTEETEKAYEIIVKSFMERKNLAEKISTIMETIHSQKTILIDSFSEFLNEYTK